MKKAAMNKPVREALPSLIVPERTGDLTTDSQALLRANGRLVTAGHSLEVAKTCVRLAERFGLDPKAMETAGLLHDIGGAPEDKEMLACAKANRWSLDPAEERFPRLMHQRFSALLAEALFGVADSDILQAIACHTTLRPHATGMDMALFLADKLSWDQGGEPRI